MIYPSVTEFDPKMYFANYPLFENYKYFCLVFLGLAFIYFIIVLIEERLKF